MGSAISSSIVQAYEIVKEHVTNLVHAIAPPLVRYVVAHPVKTAFHISSFVILLIPGSVAAPVLGMLGWTAGGIRAASFASALQSGMGAVQAGGVFATLQSAAMGGYGAAAVAGTVQAAVVAAEGAAGVAAAIKED